MPTLTTPQLHLSFEFAERLFHHLREAGGHLDAEYLIQDAETLRTEIDAQSDQVPLEH